MTTTIRSSADGTYGALQVASADVFRFGTDTSGQLAGFRNRLINSNFAVNQREVSGNVTLGAGAYGHDRWKAGAAGCTYTFATVNNITTLTITAGSLQQVIEGENLQSGTHTLSWAGTAQGKISAGAYSTSSVTGTVIGGTNLTIEFNTGTLSLPQFEPGSIATPFEHRPIGLELSLCQRYLPAYNSAGANDYFASGQCLSVTGGKILYPYKVPPRIKPTGVIVSNVGYFYITGSTGGTIACTGLSYGADSSIDAASLICGVAGGLTAGNAVLLQSASPSAQLLFTGCEL